MADHFRRAEDALISAREGQTALRTYYEDGGRQRPEYVASLHQQINYGFKAAEAHGLLAVAQRLDDLGLAR